MTDFNWGVQWDAQEGLTKSANEERERDRLEQEKVRDGRRLTPAQKRDAAYTEMAEAVHDYDSQKVQDLLAEHKKLDFTTGALAPLRAALIECFDRAMVAQFAARGLRLYAHDIAVRLIKHEDKDLLQFLLEMPDAGGVIERVEVACLRRFSPSISPARRNMFRAYHAAIAKVFPNQWPDMMSNPSRVLALCCQYTPQLPEEEKQELAQLSDRNWEEIFGHFTARITSSKPTAQTLSSIMDFCAAHRFAQDGWNAAVAKMPNTTYAAFLDAYWPQGQDFAQSQLYGVLHAFTRRTSFSNNAVKVPDVVNSKLLGIDQRTAALMLGGNWANARLYDIAGQQPPFASIPQFCPSNVVEALVLGAAPACFALLESASGKEAYLKALENKTVFYGWCNNASLDLLNSTLKSCPQLKDWRDDVGNTLAHYLVALRKEKTKSFVQLIGRANHNWFLQENNSGVSVKSLFVKNGISSDNIAFMDKENIKRSLKEAGLVKTKRTAPVKTRRL